jgi:hypothetical protein
VVGGKSFTKTATAEHSKTRYPIKLSFFKSAYTTSIDMNQQATRGAAKKKKKSDVSK